MYIKEKYQFNICVSVLKKVYIEKNIMCKHVDHPEL